MRTYFTKIALKLFLFYSCIATSSSTAQTKEVGKKNQPKGKANAIAAGINLPLGDFSNTHILGFGVEYSRSNHRFGSMKTKPSNAFGFTYNAGVDYYFGKKEKTSLYMYDYPGFSHLHAYVGAIYTVCKKGNIILTSGPGLGLYNGRTEFWWGVNMDGSYYFTEKIGIAPGIIFMKQAGADAIWSATLRAIMAL